MMKHMSRALVAAAAASMAFAPIAAQANTRAGDSAPIFSSSVSQPGLGRKADGENVVGTAGLLLALFGAAAAIGGIVAASSSGGGDDNQSPGT